MRTRDVIGIGLASAAIAWLLAVVRAPGVPGPGPAQAPSALAPLEPAGATAPPEPAPEPDPAVLPSWARPSPESAAACTAGMLLVDALHCPFLAHRCADGGGKGERCHLFVDEALCEGERRRLRFCVDRFEYPNQPGVKPAAGVSFEEAERACAAEDKRLCTVREWELACGGEGLWPLPTGVRRDPRACAIDHDRFSRSSLPPAGSRLGCASPFAVVDLLGGVDEWVVDEAGGKVVPPLRWVLAGGSSAGGRACREHLREASAAARPDAGFRCCADAAPGSTALPEAPATSPSSGNDGKKPLPGWTQLAVPDRRE